MHAQFKKSSKSESDLTKRAKDLLKERDELLKDIDEERTKVKTLMVTSVI